MMVDTIEFSGFLKAKDVTKDHALEVVTLWFRAETEGLGTLQTRVELFSYAEWAVNATLGKTSENYLGLSRFLLKKSQGER